MKKSTKSISLVLIGSSFLLAGCSSDDEDDNENRNRPVSHGGHGAFIGTRIGGTRATRGSTAGAGVSARGGFGRTGAASAGS